MGTESIKHSTATAEWHDVSNVAWRRETVLWDTEIKIKQGLIRRDEGKRKRVLTLLHTRNTLVKKFRHLVPQREEKLATG